MQLTPCVLRTIDPRWKVEGVHATIDSGVIDFLFVCDQDDPETPSPLLSATMPIKRELDEDRDGLGRDRQQAGPVLGWTSAIAAYGAFVAPVVIGDQIKAGTPQYAMYGFAIFYGLCLVLNWWFYLRRNAYVKNP